jgi:hypothetical protein
MNKEHLQVLVATVGSGLFSFLIIWLGRSNKISFRYTIGWLTLGVLGVFASFAVIVIDPLATVLAISPAAIIAIGGLLLLLLLCVQLSISISGLQRQVTELAEEIALHNSRNELK